MEPIRPTAQQHERIQRDHAARYAAIQRSADADVQRLNVLLGRPVTVPAALQQVIYAAERSAHLSRGYTPEQPKAEKLRPLNRVMRALWLAFGVGSCAAYLYFALGFSK